tara:strand:- start:1430 stop:1933 length:504 start_codon:yes stop_codon:yes gene_type:complete
MENQQKPKLIFEKKKKYKIELIFDTCKSGKNENPDGKSYSWYLYQVKYNSTEYTFFADYDFHDELKKFGRGDILEVVDNYEGDNPYGHDWSVTSVGVTGSLDKIMKDGKNETEIKIEVFASMKIASAISTNLDELKSNTHSVMALHKEICQAVKNEEEIAKNEAELF